MSVKTQAGKIPHSWAIEDWPSNVYPCRASRARYIIRAHRNDLVACRALTRIGRDLVILGAGYCAWLAKHSNLVDGFEIAANRSRGASSQAAA